MPVPLPAGQTSLTGGGVSYLSLVSPFPAVASGALIDVLSLGLTAGTVSGATSSLSLFPDASGSFLALAGSPVPAAIGGATITIAGTAGGVPLPGTGALFVAGIGGLLAARRRFG